MVKGLWNICVEYNSEPPQYYPEAVLDLIYLPYAFEVPEWVPKTSDWVSEVSELDVVQP